MANSNNNPLKPAILQILRQAQDKLAIHELLSELKSVSKLPRLHDDDQLALFRLNWMMMNALYQLQRDLVQDKLLLVISTLDIHLESYEGSEAEAESQALEQHPLRDYYLDWDNFSETTLEEVQAMLDGVWQNYLSSDQQDSAYQILGLEPCADSKTIRKRYRQLVHQNHPDKGGDADTFMEIREAYEILKKAKGF